MGFQQFSSKPFQVNRSQLSDDDPSYILYQLSCEEFLYNSWTQAYDIHSIPTCKVVQSLQLDLRWTELRIDTAKGHLILRSDAPLAARTVSWNG